MQTSYAGEQLKQTAMQTQPFETMLKNNHPVSDISIILFTEEKMFTMATPKKTRWMTDFTHVHQPRRMMSLQKNPRTWLTFSQWLMTSVGESQEADNTQTSHLSVMKLTLVRPIVVIRCCYYSVCRHTSHLKRVLHLSARYTVVTSNTGHL